MESKQLMNLIFDKIYQQIRQPYYPVLRPHSQDGNTDICQDIHMKCIEPTQKM